MQIVRVLPLLISVANALPHFEVDLPSKRQSDGVSWLCSENTCDLSGCPMSLEYGSAMYHNDRRQSVQRTYFTTKAIQNVSCTTPQSQSMTTSSRT